MDRLAWPGLQGRQGNRLSPGSNFWYRRVDVHLHLPDGRALSLEFSRIRVDVLVSPNSGEFGYGVREFRRVACKEGEVEKMQVAEITPGCDDKRVEGIHPFYSMGNDPWDHAMPSA